MEGQQQQIKKGVEGLGKQMSGVKEDLQNIDTEKLNSFSADIKKIANEYTKESTSTREAMGLTDAMVEGIYGQAYRLYNTGKYKEAVQLFKLLVMLDVKQPKYMLGLAASYHMLKEFKNALEVYTLCGIVDPESPIPHYHSSDCYIQMKDNISAIVVLEIAVARANDKPVYQTLKDRALLTIENLKKEFTPKQL